jgi:hypothetical protein
MFAIVDLRDQHLAFDTPDGSTFDAYYIGYHLLVVSKSSQRTYTRRLLHRIEAL